MSAALPRGWSRRRLRFDVRTNPVKSELELSDDTEVSFVPMDAVGELGGLRLDQTRELADVYNGYTYFADGDVCIAKITPCFENGKGAIAGNLTNGVAFGTTELHVLRPSPSLDARFLFYLTIAHDFRSYGESEMLGAGGQKRVPEGFLKDWRPPLPCIEVQQRIARFLDEKTERIDALIEKKQALLARLVEKRQALITQAVTKGLNPDVPMKPSGVDWLGEIPVHWDLKRLRFNVRANPVKSELDFPDDTEVSFVPMDAVGELGGLRLEYIRELGDVYNGYTYFANGDVCIAKITPCFENGKGAIAEGLTNGVAFGTTELHVLRPSTKLDARFLFYLTIAHNFRNHGESEMLGAGGQRRVPENFLKNWMSPLPPIEEQQFIVCLLDEETARIDALIEKLGGRDSTAGGDQSMSLLGLLSEYRSALITAAVTGQLPELNG